MTARAPYTGTFLFADIAGYTALTEAHGDDEAAELARAFCRAVSDAAAARGGEVVKTIGDAVMVRHDLSAEAVALGLAAAHEVMAGHGFPAVRVGMHHGPAVERDGDWFGATVNLAARVAAERHVDPVCRMVVAEDREAGSFRHHETVYRFCSLECGRRFLANPDAYVGRARQ